MGSRFFMLNGSTARQYALHFFLNRKNPHSPALIATLSHFLVSGLKFQVLRRLHLPVWLPPEQISRVDRRFNIVHNKVAVLPPSTIWSISPSSFLFASIRPRNSNSTQNFIAPNSCQQCEENAGKSTDYICIMRVQAEPFQLIECWVRLEYIERPL